MNQPRKLVEMSARHQTKSLWTIRLELHLQYLFHVSTCKLVVPQLVVLRFPRRRTHVVRFSGGFSTVPLPGFYSTKHLATPRRLPDFFSRHPRMEIQKDVRLGVTATTTPGPVQPFLPVNLLLRHTMVESPALMFSLG